RLMVVVGNSYLMVHVTHHAELILPGAYYLIRMLDDRIYAHDTVKDLRVQGILYHITHDAEAEAQKDQAAVDTTEEALAQVSKFVIGKIVFYVSAKSVVNDEGGDGTNDTATKEQRHSYLKALSYWTWDTLGAFVIFMQLLGFGEKFWIKVVLSNQPRDTYGWIPVVSPSTYLDVTTKWTGCTFYDTGFDHNVDRWRWVDWAVYYKCYDIYNVPQASIAGLPNKPLYLMGRNSAWVGPQVVVYLAMLRQFSCAHVSVEHVIGYPDVPQEPPAIIELNHTLAYWLSGCLAGCLVLIEGWGARWVVGTNAKQQVRTFRGASVQGGSGGRGDEIGPHGLDL
ncbi:hypothetical protein P691DRAFT_783503, partial [Macrolepiota fuliginosa MF-IS2]